MPIQVNSFINRVITATIVCLLIILFAGCAEKTPALSKLSRNAVVVAFGDSLTYGTGAKNHETYPAHLQDLTGLRVINEGIPGELSTEGKERLPSVLDKHEPELLILCHGGNDMLRKRSTQKLTDNLIAMIEEARDRGIQVVLIGVPEPALFLLESAPIYQNIANKAQIPIEINTLPEILSDNDLKSDTIHPNAAGYRKLAEAVTSLLKKAGAI